MDVQRYISSGILESYVFGMLPEAERSEVEAIVGQYPDVKAAVNSLQLDKERFVQLYAVSPPSAIKDKLTEIIRQENTLEGNEKLPEDLRIPSQQAAGEKKKTVKEAIIKQLPVAGKKDDRKWKVMTAAIVILLIGSVLLNFFFFQKSTDYKSRYKSLIATKEKLEAEKQREALTSAHSPAAPAIDPLSDPAFKWTTIQGAGLFKGKTVAVGWNAGTQAVYLQARLMPPPPVGKQFQLWAIINKKLVDEGVFETGAEAAQVLQQMKPLAAAQGFAVTLEKAGGSPKPSMDQVCMSAKIAM